MPRQLSRAGMQGDHAVGEKVVTWTDLSLEIRGRIAYAPIKKVRRWVVTPRDPGIKPYYTLVYL